MTIMTTKFSVTKNGKPFTDYKWDEKTKTFSTTADGLVLNFAGIGNVTFKTGRYCTFKTGYECSFTTGWGCTFTTGDNCTFTTGWDCTFTTGPDCTFKTGPRCTFNTGDNCFVTRFDVKGVTEIPEGKTIKFNEHKMAGYEVIEEKHTITIDGKEIELSQGSYNQLKQSLT